MFRLRQNYRLNRILFWSLVLLLSNVAMLSCAMAAALCTDCPEHEPVLCVEPCVTVEAVVADHSADGSPNERPGGATRVHVSVIQSDMAPAKVLPPDILPQGSAPPINVRNCVFLK